jgi:hypothetical protein
MRWISVVLFLCIALIACSNSNTSPSGTPTTDQYTPPPPGNIVAYASMPVVDDPLNHFTFSVKVITDNKTATYGTYAVIASFGPDEASATLTMPHGGAHLKPLIRKGLGNYAYIIGFKFGRDSAFYDYFQVTGSKTTIKMAYLKGYNFQ